MELEWNAIQLLGSLVSSADADAVSVLQEMYARILINLKV